MYRKKKLPFKVINVPVLLNAKTKWENDAYISKQFNDDMSIKKKYSRPNGKCQESRTNFDNKKRLMSFMVYEKLS